jgi:hypothetical protein
VAVFGNLQEVPTLAIGERGQAPVVNKQHLYPGDSGEQFDVAAVGVRDFELFQKPWQPLSLVY